MFALPVNIGLYVHGSMPLHQMPTCHSTHSLAGQAGYAIQQQLLQQEAQVLHSVSALLSSHFTGELLTSCCQRRQQQGIMSEVVLYAPRHAETYMHTCHKMPRCALELQLNCTLKSSRAKLVPQIWHGCTRHPSQRGTKAWTHVFGSLPQEVQ